MADYPETSASLIAAIQDRSNADAWHEFEQIYRPVIFRVARAKGLQNADAFDLVQQVLVSVAMAIPRYEARSNGPPFRNWLSRITHNAILKAVTRKPRDQARGGPHIIGILDEIKAPDAATQSLIQLEYRREIFRVAAHQARSEVQPATWLAFESTVVDGQSIERTAKVLNVSVGNVYAARSRVMKRLRKIVREMDAGMNTIGYK